MRPRKVILYVDSRESSLSVRRFLLETHGYRVISQTNGNDAINLIHRYHPGAIDLVITTMQLDPTSGDDLARHSKVLRPDLPVMIIAENRDDYDASTKADIFLTRNKCNSTEILERVKCLVARKRGPKKKVAELPQSEVATV